MSLLSFTSPPQNLTFGEDQKLLFTMKGTKL